MAHISTRGTSPVFRGRNRLIGGSPIGFKSSGGADDSGVGPIQLFVSKEIDSDEWKDDMQEKIGEMEAAMNQEAERKIKQLLQSVSEFLIVIGLVMFIIFGACWVGLERKRMLNLPVTAED